MTFALLPLLFLFMAQSDPQPSPTPGIKLTIRYSSPGGMVNEQTVYLHSDRRRTEFRNSTGGPKKADGTMQTNYGPRLAAIQRCDLGQAFELNLDDRQYTTAPYPPLPLTQEQMRDRGFTPGLRYLSDKPTLKVEITTVDTNERKQLFDHTARHIITTHRQIPLEGSQSEPSETVTDGWYIDLDTLISCDRRPPSGEHGYAYIIMGNKPIERRTVVRKGKAETGFPVELTTTSRSTTVLADGTRKELISRSEMTVTDLEEKPLDPGLFEVPSGFRKVDAIRRNPPSSLSTWAAFKQWLRGILP